MNPIWCQMKKSSPFSVQNGQLLVHSAHFVVPFNNPNKMRKRAEANPFFWPKPACSKFSVQFKCAASQMENILWVKTIKCAGHHNHGSCCPSSNSQGTVLQYPCDFFNKFSFLFLTTWEGKPMAVVFTTIDGRVGFEGRKKEIRRKRCHRCCGRVPWLLVQGKQLAWYCGQCI